MGDTEIEVARAVGALAELSLEALRDAWREQLGPVVPPLRSPDHLRRLLAWRLQAEVLGGLDAETRRSLTGPSRRSSGPLLPVGARVMREWRGVAHEVEIAEAGVLYAGQLYGSLSEVARTITGVRWSGPRFFGLRDLGGA